MPAKKSDESRLNIFDLEDACLDCADFLNHPCVECEDCPIERLKIRLKRIRDNNERCKEECENECENFS